jgi:hypothetical protein
MSRTLSYSRFRFTAWGITTQKLSTNEADSRIRRHFPTSGTSFFIVDVLQKQFLENERQLMERSFVRNFPQLKCERF